MQSYKAALRGGNKKTDEWWYIEWQRVRTSDTTSDNEWQRVKANGTTTDIEWKRVTKYDNEWLFRLIFAFSNKTETYH